MKKKKEINELMNNVLCFLGDDEGSTDHLRLSFECGILAALDWLTGNESIYAQLVDDIIAADWSTIDVGDPKFVEEQEKRIKAAQRVAWDMFHSIGNGDPETFYHPTECEVTEEEYPYILKECMSLEKEFALRAGLENDGEEREEE